MAYNLTDSQKEFCVWIVGEVRKGSLDEKFKVYWQDFEGMKGKIANYRGDHPEITSLLLDILEELGFIGSQKSITKEKKDKITEYGIYQYGHPKHEKSRLCTLRGEIYNAVDSNFVGISLYPQPPALDFDMWENNHFRLFISHKTSQKRFADELREVLLNYHISSFVAHKDIEPTQEWQEKIESGLNSCDALVALLSPDFHESDWTNQEVGWVLGQNKLIVSVDLGLVPYGFLGKEQALPYKGDSLEKLGFDIYDILKKNQKTFSRINEAYTKLSPRIMNPGFEEGFKHWDEGEESYMYSNQSEDDTSVIRSGKHSRKLFLRQGGTKIRQRIPARLPVGSSISLSTWANMPKPGSEKNKYLTLELLMIDSNGQA